MDTFHSRMKGIYASAFVVQVNSNYLKLKAGYLFPEISKSCPITRSLDPLEALLSLGKTEAVGLSTIPVTVRAEVPEKKRRVRFLISILSRPKKLLWLPTKSHTMYPFCPKIGILKSYKGAFGRICASDAAKPAIYRQQPINPT